MVISKATHSLGEELMAMTRKTPGFVVVGEAGGVPLGMPVIAEIAEVLDRCRSRRKFLAVDLERQERGKEEYRHPARRPEAAPLQQRPGT